MLELGKAAEDEHRRLGRWIAKHSDANLIAVGDHAEWIADAAAGSNRSTARAADAEEAYGALRGQVRSGDTVLIKGSRGLRLEVAAQDLIKHLRSED